MRRVVPHSARLYTRFDNNSLLVEGKGDLFPSFLHRSPDCHLVDRRPESRHERLRQAKVRQRAQKPQLPSDLRRDPLVEGKPQQYPRDRTLMPATRTLDLHLSKHHPGEGPQNLRGLGTPRLPDEMVVISSLPTGEELLSPGHQKLSIVDQGLLQKVPQKLRKENRKCRQQGLKSDIRQAEGKLTPKLDFEIFLLWEHSLMPSLGLVNLSEGHSNHIQKGVSFQTLYSSLHIPILPIS